MIDALYSPVLFPSDMDSSKLTADPNFKLPEPINWTDHDYHNTMTNKSMGTLTDLIKLEPVKENDIYVYSPFISTVIPPKLTSVLNHKATGGVPEGDYTQRLALLALAQSMVHAYTLPIHPQTGTNNQDNNYGEGQKGLWTNLRSALDVVENDLQRTGQDSLYPLSKQQNGNIDNSTYYQDNIDDDWSWCEDLTDVPDLVHSVGSSPSLHSLVDNHQPSSTLELLESDVYAHLHGGCQFEQVSSSLSTKIPHQMDDKKRNKNFKNWIVKMKQQTSAMKENCVKSMSSTSRKLSRWIKN